MKDAVVRAMAKIFRHIVAKEINWEGRMRGTNQKFKFADSNIKIALFSKLLEVRAFSPNSLNILFFFYISLIRF